MAQSTVDYWEGFQDGVGITKSVCKDEVINAINECIEASKSIHNGVVCDNEVTIRLRKIRSTWEAML